MYYFKTINNEQCAMNNYV